MRRIRYAILAAFVVITAAGIGPLETPLKTRFRLADGMEVRGSITAWDETGIVVDLDANDVPVHRQWIELRTDDVWQLYRRLMDRDNAPQWVALGECMLSLPDGDDEAAIAFRRALRIDPSLSEQIEAIRARAAADQAAGQNSDKPVVVDKHGTIIAAADPRIRAWPRLEPEQQEQAVETMKEMAAEKLAAAGFELVPIETSYFLFYSNLPRMETAKWANELDKMYKRLATIFKLEQGENIFWGKAAIFVFATREEYERLEEQGFSTLTAVGYHGRCHTRGPRVFINFFRADHDLDFAATLVHETVHGFVHRYRTSRLLPTWANEGFADWVAATAFEGSRRDAHRRERGLQYIRSGGDINAVLDATYSNGGWPGPDFVHYSVSYLLVELMIRDRPQAFGAWVNAIKAGKDWETALAEDFGVDRRTLMRRFVQYYLVND